MEINVTEQPNHTEVELKGDVDLYSSPQIRNQFSKLLENDKPLILINFAGVDYIDSSGLATLIELLQKLKKSEGRLFLYHVSETVRSVFQLAKLDEFFKICDSKDAAIEAAS